MSVVRVGSTSKYAEGWTAIFEKARKKKAGGRSAKGKKKAAKRPAAKAARKSGKKSRSR